MESFNGQTLNWYVSAISGNLTLNLIGIRTVADLGAAQQDTYFEHELLQRWLKKSGLESYIKLCVHSESLGVARYVFAIETADF